MEYKELGFKTPRAFHKIFKLTSAELGIPMVELLYACFDKYISNNCRSLSAIYEMYETNKDIWMTYGRKFADEFSRSLQLSGKSLEQVAMEVGLRSSETIAKIASGETKPSLDLVESLSRAVGGDVSRLARLALLAWLGDASFLRVRRLFELAAQGDEQPR